jgi:serine/threonine-protein kinase RsbW
MLWQRSSDEPAPVGCSGRGTGPADRRMGDDHWLWRCDRVIPSRIEAGRPVIEELLVQLRARHWSRRDRFAVHLAMEEALTNAIHHGNQCDPAKQVAISCRLGPELVRIEIADQGNGFDPHAVGDPTDPDRRELPSGRGLTLIRAFMSRVEFRDCGRHLILARDRSRAA